MILEVGLFRIDPARAEEFAPVAERVRAAFARGGIRGLHSFRIGAALEDPGRWTVLVGWDSVLDHRQFVASAEGRRQRELLDRFMIEDPEVFHLELDGEQGIT
jgi:heme-degrading monooxygenase HmoA